MVTLYMKQIFNGGYSHSHQLNFKLDWSGIKLWLAQVVLTLLRGRGRGGCRDKERYRGVDVYMAVTVFDRQSSLVGCWNDAHPAAEWALHQEVFVSGVELRCPGRLEIGLEKPLAECSHWRTMENLVSFLIMSISDRHSCEAKRTFS